MTLLQTVTVQRPWLGTFRPGQASKPSPKPWIGKTLRKLTQEEMNGSSEKETVFLKNDVEQGRRVGVSHSFQIRNREGESPGQSSKSERGSKSKAD